MDLLKRLTKDKKGMMPDFIGDIAAFFLYIVLFMLFVMLFAVSFGGCENLNPSQETLTSGWGYNFGAGMYLLNVARTEVTIDSGSAQIAELVSDACNSGNNDELIAQLKILALNGPKPTKFSLNCNPGEEIGSGKRSPGVDLYISHSTNPGCQIDYSCEGILPNSYVDIPIEQTDASASPIARLTVSMCCLGCSSQSRVELSEEEMDKCRK